MHNAQGRRRLLGPDHEQWVHHLFVWHQFFDVKCFRSAKIQLILYLRQNFLSIFLLHNTMVLLYLKFVPMQANGNEQASQGLQSVYIMNNNTV